MPTAVFLLISKLDGPPSLNLSPGAVKRRLVSANSYVLRFAFDFLVLAFFFDPLR
jgi:hypothetical protein